MAQMAFEDVVELEPQPGDPDYTAWLAAGRPRFDTAKRVSRPEPEQLELALP